MKIIVGTDFSETAASAIHTAVAMARRWDDTLLLTHVIDESLSENLPQDLREKVTAFASEKLHEKARKLAESGVRVEERFLIGTPDLALADLAVQSNARLSIVASLGRRNKQWLLGSVAERLVQNSPVPTLIIRDSSPFESWMKGEKSLNIFIAFDFTKIAEKALHWVKQFQTLGPCNIIIGYVNWPPEESSRLGLEWPPFECRNPPEVEAILKRELNDRAAQILGDTNIRVRCAPSLGLPDYHLVEMACDEKADLIIAGTHQRAAFRRLWHRSTSRALLRHAPMSVLSVPVLSDEFPVSHSAEIRRVLVAVDCSDMSKRAASYAYGIVQSGGMVRLLHVVKPLESPNPLIGGYPQPSHPTEKEHQRGVTEMREEMSAMVPEDALVRGITTEISTMEARDTAKTIRQEAERFGADVICLGAHNRSRLAQIAMGSVAQAVMLHSKRPVFVVRDLPE